LQWVCLTIKLKGLGAAVAANGNWARLVIEKTLCFDRSAGGVEQHFLWNQRNKVLVEACRSAKAALEASLTVALMAEQGGEKYRRSIYVGDKICRRALFCRNAS